MAAMAAMAALLGGCGGLRTELSADRRVEILEPVVLSVVSSPVTVRWQATDVPAGVTFAVAVDRLPIPPGTTFGAAFADECDGAGGCPDAAFLAQRDVYLTQEHEVVVRRLPALAGLDGEPARPVHRATIFLVDRDGRRQGESAWTVEFRTAS
jgi:hypothetical protein